jgi:hypothetical protein
MRMLASAPMSAPNSECGCAARSEGSCCQPSAGLWQGESAVQCAAGNGTHKCSSFSSRQRKRDITQELGSHPARPADAAGDAIMGMRGCAPPKPPSRSTAGTGADWGSNSDGAGAAGVGTSPPRPNTLAVGAAGAARDGPPKDSMSRPPSRSPPPCMSERASFCFFFL